MRQFALLYITCSIFIITNNVCVADEDRTIVVHAGMLLAMPGEAPRARQSVVIKDGKILEIVDGFVNADEGAATDTTTIVDLRDKFVLPGLMDMHVHFTLDRPRPDYAKTSCSDYTVIAMVNAKKTLLAGFTTVRDLGAMRAESIMAVRDGIAGGAIAGPRILAAGESISATAGHGDRRGMREEIAGVMLSAASTSSGPTRSRYTPPAAAPIRTANRTPHPRCSTTSQRRWSIPLTYLI